MEEERDMGWEQHGSSWAKETCPGEPGQVPAVEDQQVQKVQVRWLVGVVALRRALEAPV